MELELSATHRAPARLALFAALTYGAWAIAAIWTGPRNYRTNDDVAMQAIASGDLTGAPDARWVFTGPLTAWPITSLYRIADLPWYALAQYSLQILAGAAITAVLVRRPRHQDPSLLWSQSLSSSFFFPMLVLEFHRDCLCCRLRQSPCGSTRIDSTADSGSSRWRSPLRSLFARIHPLRRGVRSGCYCFARALLSWRLGRRWLTLIGVAPVITLFVNRTLTHAFTDAPYQTFSNTTLFEAAFTARHGFRQSRFRPMLAEIGWSSSDLPFSQASSSMTGTFWYDRLLYRDLGVIKGPLHVRPAR